MHVGILQVKILSFQSAGSIFNRGSLRNIIMEGI